MRRNDQIFHDLALLRFDERGVDLDTLHLAFRREFHKHEPRARNTLDLDLVELRLHSLHLGFELGRLFHQAEKICHFTTPAIARGLQPPILPGARPRAQAEGRNLLLLLLLLRGMHAFLLGIAGVRYFGGRLAYIDDLGSGKSLEHRLHERVTAYAGFELLLARLVLRLERRCTLLARYLDAPWAASPLRELARKIVDERLAGSGLQADFEAPVLAAHEPHVSFEGGFSRQIAFFC